MCCPPGTAGQLSQDIKLIDPPSNSNLPISFLSSVKRDLLHVQKRPTTCQKRPTVCLDSNLPLYFLSPSVTVSLCLSTHTISSRSKTRS